MNKMKKGICVNKVKLLLLLVGLVTFAGCTTKPLQSFGEYQPQRYGAVDYYSWAILAPPDEVAQEISRLESDVAATGAEESLVQMAVLVSAMSTDPQQEQRALNLLSQFEMRAANGAVDSDYLVFAGLWRQLLELRQESHSVDARIQTLEQERESLSEQIRALTSIEQRLDRREQVRDEARTDLSNVAGDTVGDTPRGSPRVNPRINSAP